MVTGQDLVEWQLRVASGEPLPLTQNEITLDGWAMEARLYAENPATGFLPSTGPLTHFRLPEDEVRIDSAVEEGGDVTPFYDPMIAKLISHGATREEAAERLAEACGSVEVWPVKTNAAFLARCAGHPDFVAGDVDTGFIERRLDTLLGDGHPPAVVAGIGATALVELQSRDDEATPWSPLDGASGFRLNAAPRRKMTIECAGTAFETDLLDVDLFPEDLLVIDDDEVVVFEMGEAFSFRRPAAHAGGEGGESDGAILSPMPGKIVSVSVKAGDSVTKGQTLLVLEAMKMEHALAAPFDGIVAELSAEAGGQVSEGVVLVKLEASA
jgi:propionyl-CoA carboxylase alpha chain/3-methylcrotonyl-CoA carboxylase alpha subunit